MAIRRRCGSECGGCPQQRDSTEVRDSRAHTTQNMRTRPSRGTTCHRVGGPGTGAARHVGLGTINGPRQAPLGGDGARPGPCHGGGWVTIAHGRLQTLGGPVPRRVLHRRSVSCHLPLSCAPRDKLPRSRVPVATKPLRVDGIPRRPNTWRVRVQASVMDRRAPWQ
jgi:hypothetical protein